MHRPAVANSDGRCRRNTRRLSWFADSNTWIPTGVAAIHGSPFAFGIKPASRLTAPSPSQTSASVFLSESPLSCVFSPIIGGVCRRRSSRRLFTSSHIRHRPCTKVCDADAVRLIRYLPLSNSRLFLHHPSTRLGLIANRSAC